MTAKEIREAAKWFQSDDARGYSGKVVLKRDACGDAMSQYILATMQEDGEEKLDESVIGEYGFAWDDEEEALCLEHNGETYEMCWNGSVWTLWWNEIESWPVDIRVRSQFRALCKGLGIEPLSKLVKPLDEESK